MSQFILITGACRSGKSRYAVERAKDSSEQVLYIATCQAQDAEMRQRVAKHRKERPLEWETLENRWDLDQVLKEKQRRYGCFLVDCVTMWVSYFLMRGESDAEILEKADRFTAAIETISSVGADPRACPDQGQPQGVAPTVIAVTNEVGWGVVPESESGRRFRDLAGMVNQKLAQAADEVILMVAGIPMSVGARHASSFLPSQ